MWWYQHRFFSSRNEQQTACYHFGSTQQIVGTIAVLIQNVLGRSQKRHHDGMKTSIGNTEIIKFASTSHEMEKLFWHLRIWSSRWILSQLPHVDTGWQVSFPCWPFRVHEWPRFQQQLRIWSCQVLISLSRHAQNAKAILFSAKLMTFTRFVYGKW